MAGQTIESPLTLAAEDEPSQGFALPVGLFFLAVLIVGGSSSDPILTDVVRLMAIPVLAAAVWRLFHIPRAAGGAGPLVLLLGAAALCLAQLAPLPPDIWRRLPGRQTVVDGYQAAGLALPWLPISLTPNATWLSTFGLLPPAAMFVAVLTLNARSRRRLATVAVAAAIGSVILGMLQLAGGELSPLRPYSLTDTGAAVGFFASRNHQGTFMAVSLPLAALVASNSPGERGAPWWVWGAIGFAMAMMFVLGSAAARSRAGVILLAPGLIGAVLVAIRSRAGVRGGRRGWIPAASLAAATVLGGLLVATFNSGPLAERFESGLTEDVRFKVMPVVAEAGLRFAPVGTGVGSFAAVYPMFEEQARLTSAFNYHADSDYFEIWLESGWAGVALIGAFIAWWLFATWRIFARPRIPGAALDVAGSVVIGLVLIHSVFDYPLRTPALACLFALACGLLTRPPAQTWADEAPTPQDGSVGPGDRLSWP